MISDSAGKHAPDACQNEDVDLEEVNRILEAHGSKRSALIAILGDIQARFRYLPEAALRMVAEQTGVSLVDVYAAATFYHSFSLTPKGEHIVSCCLGTACHVRGGQGIAEELQRQLGIAPGETTEDKKFSLETVNCLGACALGPVVVVDRHYYSKVTKSRVKNILDQALKGPDRLDPAQDPRVFAIEVSCPACGQSLMDDANHIDGLHSIRVKSAFDGISGMAWISSLYGTHNVRLEPEIPEGVVPEVLCDHCGSKLEGSWKCFMCEAPMMTLGVRGGGQVHICLRRGCMNRLLDLAPGSPPAVDGVR